MKKVLLAAIAVLGCGFALTAQAGPIVYNIPEFSGSGVYYDPGPFPAYLVGTFPVVGGPLDINFVGTFGNSSVDTSAGVDVFAGSITDGFYLIGECDEYDTCWTGPGPVPFSADVIGIFGADTWSVFASQTSEYVVQLGGITVTETSTTPEPSSFLLLGTGLLGVAGALRRRLSR